MPRPSKPKSVRYATLKRSAAESETTKYYTTYKDIKKCLSISMMLCLM